MFINGFPIEVRKATGSVVGGVEKVQFAGRVSEDNVTKSADKARLPKIPGNSGWHVNDTRSFGSFQWKIPGTNGNSEKVVLFFRLGRSGWKFVFHLHVNSTYFVLGLGSTAMPTLISSQGPRAYLEIFPNRSFRKFRVNGKCLKTRVNQWQNVKWRTGNYVQVFRRAWRAQLTFVVFAKSVFVVYQLKVRRLWHIKITQQSTTLNPKKIELAHCWTRALAEL